MPPKQTSSPKPTQQQLDAINAYLAQKPDFDKLVAEAKANSIEANELPKPTTDYERKLREAVKESLSERQRATS